MPFKSEKQRRWMYANKPEMAKRWSAEYKADGGFLGALGSNWEKLKAHKGESEMVKRNRLSAQYQRLRNAGEIPEGMKFNDWIKTSQGQQASANTTGEAVQSVGESMEMLPVIGDVRAMENAWDAIQSGDYTKAATEVGLTALGFVPFAGMASKAGKAIRGMKKAEQMKELRKLGFSAADTARAMDNPDMMDALIGDALYSGNTTVDNLVEQGVIAKDYAEGAKRNIADLKKFEEVTGVRPNFTGDNWNAQTVFDEVSDELPYGTQAAGINVPAPLDARRQFVIDHELGHLQNPYGVEGPRVGKLATLAEEEAANRYAANRAAERGGPTRPDWYDPETSESLNESYGSYLNAQEIMVDPEGNSVMVDVRPTFDEAGEFTGNEIFDAGNIPEESNVYDIINNRAQIGTFGDESQDAFRSALTPEAQEMFDARGDQIGGLRQTSSLHPWDFMTGDQRYGPEAGTGYDVGGIWPDAEGNLGTAEAVTGGPRTGAYKQSAPLSAKTGNYSDMYGKKDVTESARTAANPKLHSGDHRPDLTRKQKELAGTDVEHLLGPGRGKGTANDKVWTGINTAQGKRDFIQYEDPDGNIIYFMADDSGAVRQIPAGDVPFEQLDKNTPDTIATWAGKDNIPGQIKKQKPAPLGAKVKDTAAGDEALRNRARKIWEKLEAGKQVKKTDEDWLYGEGQDYLNKGGRAGPLGYRKGGKVNTYQRSDGTRVRSHNRKGDSSVGPLGIGLPTGSAMGHKGTRLAEQREQDLANQEMLLNVPPGMSMEDFIDYMRGQKTGNISFLGMQPAMRQNFYDAYQRGFNFRPGEYAPSFDGRFVDTPEFWNDPNRKLKYSRAQEFGNHADAVSFINLNDASQGTFKSPSQQKFISGYQGQKLGPAAAAQGLTKSQAVSLSKQLPEKERVLFMDRYEMAKSMLNPNYKKK